MHADNRGLDHLDSGIMGSGERFSDAAPNTGRRHLTKRL